jgi:hypothetical protein
MMDQRSLAAAEPTPNVLVEESLGSAVPRTRAQTADLLERRPQAWEYLLFAGVLAQGKSALESKWRNHLARKARATGPTLNDQEAFRYVSAAIKEFGSDIAAMALALDPGSQESAFGPPGSPGDATRIERLGRSVLTSYASMMDCAARLRNAEVSPYLRHLFDAAARFADEPLSEVRSFIDQLVAEFDLIPEKLAKGEKVTINLLLTITVNKVAQEELNNEIQRLTPA